MHFITTSERPYLEMPEEDGCRVIFDEEQDWAAAVAGGLQLLLSSSSWGRRSGGLRSVAET